MDLTAWLFLCMLNTSFNLLFLFLCFEFFLAYNFLETRRQEVGVQEKSRDAEEPRRTIGWGNWQKPDVERDRMEVHLWKERVYRHEMLRDERAQGLKGHTGQGHMVRPRDSDRTRIPLKSGCGLTCHGAFLMGHEADTCGVVKSSLDRGLPPSLT